MNGFTIKKNPDREGFALVTALLVVLVLSILAVGVAWLASTEKKTSWAQGVHVEAIFTADAGGEVVAAVIGAGLSGDYAELAADGRFSARTRA